MTLFQADLQLAVARSLRWMPDRITLAEDTLTLEGWALSVWDAQTDRRFLINGVDFDVLAWPLPSPDLLACFPDMPHAEASRFRCQHYFSDPATLFPDGLARFNVVSAGGEHAWSYRSAWFLADPTRERPLPPPAQIAQVIGAADASAFCWGGATIVSRFAHLLAERFGRPLSSFASILDWGCGAGRLTRYLLAYGRPVIAIDTNPEMAQLCQRTLPDATCWPVDLLPPTPLAAASVDLVIGLAVMPHLTEAAQDAWLAELQRLTRPGGMLLLSVQGMAQMALYAAPPARKQAAHHLGFHDACGPAGPQAKHDRDVLHSPDYIVSHWGRYFDVLDIIEAMAGNQDVVVLRRRAD